MTNPPDIPDPPPAGTTPPISPTPPIPAAPPTIPGPISPVERRSVWPTPIGIIVIVFSAWTLLWGSIAVIQGFSGSQFMGGQFMATDPRVSETIARIYSNAAPRFLVSGACLMIATALGLTGGIALLCRKRWCVRILRLWVIVQIIAAAVSAVTQAMLQSQMMNALAQSTAGGPPITMAMPMSIFNGVIRLIFGAALPIFVLIWFARRSIRADFGKW